MLLLRKKHASQVPLNLGVRQSKNKAMGLLEFVLTTGRIGAFLVLGVFITVLWFAAPGKEIYFLGIRFHKRYLHLHKLRRFLPLPRPLPPEWRVILASFGYKDTTHMHSAELYEYTKRVKGITEMQTIEACNRMKARGLLNFSAGYYIATERAIPLIVRNQLGAKKID